MKAPSTSDKIVKVRAYLTDEAFGYDHWRAAQFSAPNVPSSRYALLQIFDSEAERDAAMERTRSPLPAEILSSERRTPDGPRATSSSCPSCLSFSADLASLKAELQQAENFSMRWQGRAESAERAIDDLRAELVALKAERAKAVEELKCFMGGWLEGGCQSVSEAIHAVRCNHEQTLAQLQRLVGDKLSPASAERAWQPIETAPKDGTVVALWDDRQHVAFTGFYSRPLFQGSMWWMNNGNIVHPTHWDGLPPPPASSEREQEQK